VTSKWSRPCTWKCISYPSFLKILLNICPAFKKFLIFLDIELNHICQTVRSSIFT